MACRKRSACDIPGAWFAGMVSPARLWRISDAVSIQTTFFSSANKAYEMFVAPYIASVLAHNDDARVEICLDDAAAFARANGAALAILRAGFGQERFHLRNAAPAPDADREMPPNSVRFVQTPDEITTYTYIGDIDMLVLESVTDKHLRRMRRTGLPYSNVLRPSGKALSGLHFTESDAYYPVRLPPGATLNMDERLLYEMVMARGLGLPDPEDRWRPMHGYHLSLRRPPLAALGWGVVVGQLRPPWHPLRWWRALHRLRHGKATFSGRRRFRAYRALQRHAVWREALAHFDDRYLALLGLLEAALAWRVAAGELPGRFRAPHARTMLEEAPACLPEAP